MQNLITVIFYYELQFYYTNFNTLTEMTGITVLFIFLICQLIMIDCKPAESPDKCENFFFFYCAIKLLTTCLEV